MSDQRTSFELRTRDEAVPLAQMLTVNVADRLRAEVALVEIMLNAIEHGNLEIDGELKAELLRRGEFEDEIARRHTLEPYLRRVVSVEVVHDGRSTAVVITDQGPGFPWQTTLAKVVNAELNGRGIMLALSCGCELAFNDLGNSVTLRFWT